MMHLLHMPYNIYIDALRLFILYRSADIIVCTIAHYAAIYSKLVNLAANGRSLAFLPKCPSDWSRHPMIL